VARYFFGAAIGGRLRLRDIPDWGYWNSKSIAYWDESHIDGVSRLAALGRKIRSADALDDAISESLDLPGIEALWIHERLLAVARGYWKEARRTVRNRLESRAPAAAAAAAVAACLAGAMLTLHGPAHRVADIAPRVVLHGDASAPAPPRRAWTSVGQDGGVGPHRRPAAVRLAGRLPRTARHGADWRRPRNAYAVTLGTFVTAAHANRIKHFVQSKGYIVRVVPRGALSQVVTRPYSNRTQAERIARGLLAAGLPAQLTSWRGL
jgi:cell division septation protein DedD